MGIFADYARKYWEAGYSVLPINEKRPIPEKWEKYCQTSATEEELEEWVKQYPNANIGFALGPASNICAVDFDLDFGDSEKIQNFLNGYLPQTPLAKVGKKGWTKFYKNSHKKTSSWFQKGNHRMIDFLCDGKQTVVPPSIHPSTNLPYRWLGEDAVYINPIDLPEIPDGFEWFCKILAGPEEEIEKTLGLKTGRHDQMIGYGIGVIHKYDSIEKFAEALIKFDEVENKGQEYLKDKTYFKNKNQTQAAMEIAKKIEKSAARYRKKTLNIDGWYVGKKVELNDIESVVKNARPFYEEVVTNEKKGTTKMVPQYNEFADYLKENNVYKSCEVATYLYRDGYWQSAGEVEKDNLVLRINRGITSPGHLSFFKRAADAKCFDANILDGGRMTDGLLNLNNGVLNVSTGELKPHSWEYLFKNKIDVDYDANAKCLLWFKFLNEIFNHDQELIDLAQEIIGYILLGGDPFLHKAFVLVGEGRNGKSTFIDVFRKLIGKGAASVSIKLLDKPFSAVALDGKIANLVEETPSGEINAEAFKAAVGGGLLTVAHKGYDEYDLRVQARFVFACNKMPTFDDKNESLIDRLEMLPFKSYIEEENRDSMLPKKLAAEISGILNWAIVGAKRVAEKRTLTKPLACKSMKEEFKKDNDNVYAWASENIKIGKSGVDMLTSREVYERYCFDLGVNNNKPLSYNNFCKRFKKFAKNLAGMNNIFFDEDFKLPYKDGNAPRGYDALIYDGAYNKFKIPKYSQIINNLPAERREN